MPTTSILPPDPETVATLDGFLVGSESVAAALVGRDGVIVEANGALARLTGPASSIHDTVVPAQRGILTELVAGAGPRWHSAQAGLVRPDGDVVDCKIWAVSHHERILVLAEPLRTPAEKLNTLLLDLNDDLLKARRELADGNRRLRELDELKNKFLHASSHDLKQPLMAILGYTELLDEDDQPAQTRRMAQIIEKNARRVTSMINDLVGAAWVMTGALELQRSRVDVVALVRTAVEGIHPAAQAGSVTVTQSGIESAEAEVDCGRVLQILDNLLSNAVKYSPDGGHVSVDCALAGESLTVTVTDTGIGIPVEEQPRIFERFFRASTAVGGGMDGTGHGLANARAFSEAHGGRLTCSSEPGSGSTFTLTLPVLAD
ncbi:sensor histidine kinase [Nocardioides piscis]|uniref:histidine kinase n=1 Tax=Nocardioides piscis TaxID=2714938 RepID=A0A6G7YCN3_9ACTN|nr:HAMP domain-containing sensor histidine kinase [Nocardioides piscis]QIK74582.1 HAMP domain-containing histidine kinase [Nocardioides piscis]